MIQPALTPTEIRVLGSLAEKAVTTPDNYPLSASALQAACNQSTNREPVMQLDENAVMDAVVALRRRNLVRAIQPIGSRVTKYQHLLAESLTLTEQELAVFGVLMLRGEQTVGELHTRTARLADFADAAAVEQTLEALMAREPEPYVARQPRRPGQKEVRYAQLLGGPVEPGVDVEVPLGSPRMPVREEGTRVAALESEVAELKRELAALRMEFEEWKGRS